LGWRKEAQPTNIIIKALKYEQYKKLKITNFKGIKDLELDFTYQNTDKILDNEKLIDATLEYHQNNGLKWKIQNSFTYLSSYRLLNPSTVQSAGDWNQIYQRNRKFENNYRTVKQYLVNLITDKKVETLTSKNRQVLEKIKQSFKIFFPQKVFLEQLSRTEDTKDYRLMIKNEDGTIVDLDQLSSGEREVIAFFTYLCTKATNNSILIIDEPELHLHSKWQSISFSQTHNYF